MRCLLIVLLCTSIMDVYANKPAAKLRGTAAQSNESEDSCLRLGSLQKSYERCGNEDCKTLYRSTIRGVREETLKESPDCVFLRSGEKTCQKLDLLIQEYNQTLNNSPQDLYATVERITSLNEKISANYIVCSFDAPQFDLCAQVKTDIVSIDKECLNNTLCRSYYKKRAETILSQLQKNYKKCDAKIPGLANDEFEQYVEVEQAEGIEIIQSINVAKEGSCRRAKEELARFGNCDDIECEMEMLESIRESLQQADESGEDCVMTLPKVEFCARATRLLRTYHQCEDDMVCQNENRNLLERVLEFAAQEGQSCGVSVPVIKTAAEFNQSAEYQKPRIVNSKNSSIASMAESHASKMKEIEAIKAYGYSISIEL